MEKTEMTSPDEEARVRELGKAMANAICQQVDARRRESLEVIVANVNQDENIPTNLKEDVTALLRERYRSVQDPWKVEGYTHILAGDIRLRNAPTVYEPFSKERLFSQESRLTYKLDDHPDFGYPSTRLHLSVTRKTILDTTDCVFVSANWNKRGDYLFDLVERFSVPITIDVSPGEAATVEQMIPLIELAYKIPKLPSRVIQDIKQAKRVITKIDVDNYSCKGKNTHRQPAPMEVTLSIQRALSELEAIPLYGKNPVPQSVEQELAVATHAINGIVKYYDKLSFPIRIKGSGGL